jgi:predicted NUDIX family phosphoesterase
MDEQVLVIDAEHVADLYRQPCFETNEEVCSEVHDAIKAHAYLTSRRQAESNPQVKQLVAVSVVRNGARLLCIRRSKKSNRAHMRLKYTLVVGGHVDEGDVKGGRDPLQWCAERELKEEIGVVPGHPLKFLGFIADPLTESGNLHLAVVFDAKYDGDSVEIGAGLDNAEFVGAAGRNVWALRPLAEIQGIAASNAFDRWSTLIIHSRRAAALLDVAYPVVSHQTELRFA